MSASTKNLLSFIIIYTRMDSFMRDKIVPLILGHFLFWREHDISMHENDKFAIGMMFYRRNIGLFTISCVEFSSVKIYGQKIF